MLAQRGNILTLVRFLDWRKLVFVVRNLEKEGKNEEDLSFGQGDNGLISGEQEGRHGHVDNDAMKPIDNQNCHKDNTKQRKWH